MDTFFATKRVAMKRVFLSAVSDLSEKEFFFSTKKEVVTKRVSTRGRRTLNITQNKMERSELSRDKGAR